MELVEYQGHRGDKAGKIDKEDKNGSQMGRELYVEREREILGVRVRIQEENEKVMNTNKLIMQGSASQAFATGGVKRP